MRSEPRSFRWVHRGPGLVGDRLDFRRRRRALAAFPCGHLGRIAGAAVTQVQGAVVGAIALIGFAGVAAANIPALPLAVAQLAALAAWVACAIGGYLAQAPLLPTWHEAVRELARQRSA